MAAIIILLGAPGAGKGTQAVRLSAALEVPHISTGDLFRANLAAGTPVGKRAQEFMEKGELVPDEVVLDMLSQRVAEDDCREGYLLDGFPRTLPQAEALQERLTETDHVRVINLEVADDTIIERAAGRLLCKSCGNIQHKSFAPPKQEGVCDNCGGELYQRKDDAPDVVRQRLSVYHEQTEPLVRFYEAKGAVETVNGEAEPDVVFAALERLLAGKG